MIMKWEDLMPGDKVRFSKKYETISLSWAYSYECGILEITRVDIKDESIHIYHRPYGTTKSPLFVIVDKEGAYDSRMGPVFEIVELAEDK